MFRDISPPSSLYHKVTAVADHERGFYGKLYDAGLRRGFFDDHADASVTQLLANIVQPFQHEMIMPFIRFGKSIGKPEIDQKRLL